MTQKAEKDFEKLDKAIQKRIVSFVRERILFNSDPRALGKALMADFKGYWAYRIGDYRLIVEICDHELTIIAIKIDHRRTVYD